MKPKCEWLKGKLEQREANREAESQSLKDAVKLLKDWVDLWEIGGPQKLGDSRDSKVLNDI